MFTIWYLMSIGFMICGALSGTGLESIVYAMGLAFLGAFDMLVCNIVLRLKKRNEYDDWAMKFNDQMRNCNEQTQKQTESEWR